jgi:hypothetical protein
MIVIVMPMSTSNAVPELTPHRLHGPVGSVRSADSFMWFFRATTRKRGPKTI